jgi:hypothetical protein
MSPIDAIRQDFQLVKSVLDERARERAAVPEPVAVGAPAADDVEQLGLF